MANWRPVDVRVWNDRKFLACSDDARLLWMFLLTCPSLPIPGVIVGGDAALAEQLGWTVERLRERFQELSRNGLKVVRETRIVWLPNALKYQPPSNPNMVKGWSKKWDDVPEGPLRAELWEALRISCKTWSILFAKLFAKPLEDGSRNGSPNGLGNGYAHDHQHDHQHQHDHDRVPPPAILSSDFDPADARSRGRLAESTYQRVSEARITLAQKLSLPEQLPFQPITPSTRPQAFTDLLDRVREEGATAPAACNRVVENLIAQALETRDIEWLSLKAFGAKAWAHARERIPGKSRSPPRMSRGYDPAPPLRIMASQDDE